METTKFAKPLTTDDGTFTSAVSEIDWTGGTIPVGQFGEFNILAQGIPRGTAGARVQDDPVLQRRHRRVVDSGARPHRTNPAHPAPTLTLTAPEKTGSSRGRGIDRELGCGHGGDRVGQRCAVDRHADPGGLHGAAQLAHGVARPSEVRRAGHP